LAISRREDEAPAPPSYAGKLRLGAEVLFLYARTRLAMSRDDLPTVAARLRARRSPARPVSRDARLRLEAVVMRMLSRLPTDSPCLIHSFVLLGLLERRGARTKLVIGVTSGPEFEAHAWVECEDEALLPTGNGKYEPITTI
jgi:Transglutaminase-like superfamily